MGDDNTGTSSPESAKGNQPASSSGDKVIVLSDFEAGMKSNMKDSGKGFKKPEFPGENFSRDRLLKELDRGEDGDADLYTNLFNGKYAFDHSAASQLSWYYWNDHYWRLDTIDQALRNTRKVMLEFRALRKYERLCFELCQKNNDGDGMNEHEANIKRLSSRIEKLHTLFRKKNILIIAASGLRSLGIPGDAWDSKPMLLGCRNGCIDLKTGICRPGDPKDYIKTVSPIHWKGINEPCPVFDQFIFDIFSEDIDLINYIFRLFGYGITGHSTEDIFPFFYGETGRNGKTTLLQIMKHVLGELAYKAPSDFLMEKKNDKGNGGHDAELMALRGSRIVWCSETKKRDKLDTTRLKELTGGDTISARPPYGKRQIEFEPSHLIIIIGNRKPQIPADDPAMWKRIHLIEFKTSFVEDPSGQFQKKIDQNLFEKLKAEASGILAWLVRGCLTWQKEGIRPPKSVQKATEQYQVDEDITGHFITECCWTGEGLREEPKNLYAEYKNWSLENGHHKMAKHNFLKDMRSRFGEEIKTRDSYFFYGVSLIR